MADPNPAVREAFVAKFPQTRVFDSLESMLAQPAGPDDIVITATPPVAHCEPTLAALESGRHVLCEKPLAMDVDQARQMLATAKQKNRMLGCCSCRFLGLAAAAEAKRMMRAGELGEPYHMTWINRRLRGRPGIEYQPQSRWFLDSKINGGGTVMDWGPYDFAAMIELLEPVRLDVRSAWLARPKTAADPVDIDPKTEQHAADLLFHCRDGRKIPVTYERSACIHGHESSMVELEGDRGAVRWDWLGGGKVEHSFDESGKLLSRTTQHPDPGSLGPHDKPIVFFHRRVIGQSAPAIVNEQALFNFSCLRAIYDAARTGQCQTVVQHPA